MLIEHSMDKTASQTHTTKSKQSHGKTELHYAEIAKQYSKLKVGHLPHEIKKYINNCALCKYIHISINVLPLCTHMGTQQGRMTLSGAEEVRHRPSATERTTSSVQS